MRLFEVFEKPHEWRWLFRDHDEFRAGFAASDGNAVEVFLARSDISQGGEEWRDEGEFRYQFIDPRSVWEFAFMRDGSEDITGQGDAFRIFTTLAEIVQDFVRSTSPKFIVFRAKAEQSRVRLYTRMLPRLANYLNMEWRHIELPGPRHHFILMN